MRPLSELLATILSGMPLPSVRHCIRRVSTCEAGCLRSRASISGAACAVALLLCSCVEEPYQPPAIDGVRATVFGKAVDTDGKPIHGVSVHVEGRFYRSDANGLFTIRDLPAEIVELSLSRNEFTDSTFLIELLPGEQWQDSCPMRPFYVTVTGVVAGAGSGVGISVPGQNRDTLTDHAGAFTLQRVIPGDSVVVIAADPIRGWGQHTFYQVAPGSRLQTTVVLDKHGGTLRGVVHGEDSAGAAVSMMAGSYTAVTDTAGQFELRNVPTDVTLELNCEAVRTESHTTGIVVPASGQVTIDLALTADSLVPTESGTMVLPRAVVATQEQDSVDVALPMLYPLSSSDTVPAIALYLLRPDELGASVMYSSSPRFQVPAPAFSAQPMSYDYGFLPVAGDTIWGALSVKRTVPPVSYIRLDRVRAPFTAITGGRTPPSDTLRLWSSGTMPVTVNLRADRSWIMVPTAPQTSSDSTDTVAIPLQITLDTLSPGSYTGVVECVNAADTTDRRLVEVALTVVDSTPPGLAVDRTRIDIGANAGSDAGPDSIRVWNDGGGTLTFAAEVISADTGLGVSLAPQSGSSTGPSDTTTLHLSFTTASLSIGTYTARVSIYATNAPGDTHTVDISVSLGGPSIAVAFPTGLLRNDTLYTTRDNSDGRTHADTLLVWNGGTGQLDFTMTHSGPGWLSDPVKGGVSLDSMQPVAIPLSINDIGFYTTGTYTANLTLDGGAGVSPRQLHLTIDVDSAVTLKTIARIGNRTIAAGDQGMVLVSTNDSVWTERTLEGLDDSIVIEDIYSDGSSLLCVGRSTGLTPTGYVWTSDDGDTWIRRTTHSGAAHYGCASDGNMRIVVGDGGAAYSSTDLAGWQIDSLGTPDPLYGIARRSLRWAAVGYGIIATTDDGHVWQQRFGDPGFALNAVACHDTMGFVAVGDGGALFHSPDGIDWTEQTPPSYSFNYNAVTWAGSQFVAVGNDGIVIYSPDGASWDSWSAGVASRLYDVEWTGTKLIVVAENGTILSAATPNGNWMKLR